MKSIEQVSHVELLKLIYKLKGLKSIEEKLEFMYQTTGLKYILNPYGRKIDNEDLIWGITPEKKEVGPFTAWYVVKRKDEKMQELFEKLDASLEKCKTTGAKIKRLKAEAEFLKTSIQKNAILLAGYQSEQLDRPLTELFDFQHALLKEGDFEKFALGAAIPPYEEHINELINEILGEEELENDGIPIEIPYLTTVRQKVALLYMTGTLQHLAGKYLLLNKNQSIFYRLVCLHIGIKSKGNYETARKEVEKLLNNNSTSIKDKEIITDETSKAVYDALRKVGFKEKDLPKLPEGK